MNRIGTPPLTVEIPIDGIISLVQGVEAGLGGGQERFSKVAASSTCHRLDGQIFAATCSSTAMVAVPSMIVHIVLRPLLLHHRHAVPSILWLSVVKVDIIFQGRVIGITAQTILAARPVERAEAGAGVMRAEWIRQASIGHLLVHRRRRQMQRRLACVHDCFFGDYSLLPQSSSFVPSWKDQFLMLSSIKSRRGRKQKRVVNSVRTGL